MVGQDFEKEREQLYRTICALNEEDFHKASSYVLFLQFSALYRNGDMTELLQERLTREIVDTFDEGGLKETVPDNTTESHSDWEAEDFYMPIRSERLLQLQKNDAAESLHESAYEEGLSSIARSPSDTSEHRLKSLRFFLHLNLSELNSLFSTGLPVPGETEQGKEERVQLQYCLEIMERLKTCGIPRWDLAIRCALPDGASFLEKMAKRDVTDETWEELRKNAEQRKDLRRQGKGASEPFHSPQTAIDLYATPLYCEVR